LTKLPLSKITSHRQNKVFQATPLASSQGTHPEELRHGRSLDQTASDATSSNPGNSSQVNRSSKPLPAK